MLSPTISVLIRAQMNASLGLNSTFLASNATSEEPGAPQARHGNPVVAFIIGLAIILLASILNAAGLNLTKLDHVRARLALALHAVGFTGYVGSHKRHSEGPETERLVTTVMATWNGIIHVSNAPLLSRHVPNSYSLSQVIGSTLALEYMRAGQSGVPSTFSRSSNVIRLLRIRCTAWLNIIDLQFPLCKVPCGYSSHELRYLCELSNSGGLSFG